MKPGDLIKVIKDDVPWHWSLIPDRWQETMESICGRRGLLALSRRL